MNMFLIIYLYPTVPIFAGSQYSKSIDWWVGEQLEGMPPLTGVGGSLLGEVSG